MEKNKKIKLPQISQEKTTMSGPTFWNTNLGDRENGTKKENDKRIQRGIQKVNTTVSFAHNPFIVLRMS